MEVIKLSEHGYDEAVLGFSLSYNSTIERTKQILPKYSFGIPGESKFLESIQIWLDVIGSRTWWVEADTYRVGSTKQSESTMHTLSKKPLTQENFEYYVNDEYLKYLNIILESVKNKDGVYTLVDLKNGLPEGFLQRRIWNINYKTLQNIYNQRKNHRLPQWHKFLDELIPQLEHPEFIIKDYIG